MPLVPRTYQACTISQVQHCLWTIRRSEVVSFLLQYQQIPSPSRSQEWRDYRQSDGMLGWWHLSNTCDTKLCTMNLLQAFHCRNEVLGRFRLVRNSQSLVSNAYLAVKLAVGGLLHRFAYRITFLYISRQSRTLPHSMPKWIKSHESSPITQ